ncbi:MAG: dTMP kinase [Methanomassiliicoccaceae archaeon]|jgi:dTMP kinase|nr:dTMP kinase [Methanomassiliicoccaceae archaeon]
MKKGLFVVFEGIDGSGKSSCMEAVASALGKDADVVRTAEPTRGKIGMLIRSSPEIMPETEALLFTADRAEHTIEIKKWVEEKKTVLCDRYYASTVAYQSSKLDGRAVSRPWLMLMNFRVIVQPDITFLFDIDPRIGLERVESRGSKSKFERLEYLSEVRRNYLRIAKKYNFTVIDASRSREEVFNDVMGHILNLIQHKDNE